MTEPTTATSASTVCRPPRRPRRRAREPISPPRQVKLLGRLVRWLLSHQVPIDIMSQIGGVQ